MDWIDEAFEEYQEKESEMKTITIIVENWFVQSVHWVPEGYWYKVIDKDRWQRAPKKIKQNPKPLYMSFDQYKREYKKRR